MQGNLAAATRWANSSGVDLEESVSFLREPEYFIVARVMIAKKNRAVLALLDRLLQDAESRGRMGSAIRILVLRALGLQALADPAGALHALEKALALGAPEGYVRVFVDEGAPMAKLLRRARVGGIVPDHAARLLGVFRGPAADVSTGSAPHQPGGPGAFAEPLTDREREILRLIVAGASNREIARRLVVTTNTVKVHVYHLFGKLDVKSRTQAVIKAKELGLD